MTDVKNSVNDKLGLMSNLCNKGSFNNILPSNQRAKRG